MRAIRRRRERLGAVRHAEGTYHRRRREHREPISLKFPELVYRVRLPVLKLSDLVVVRVVLVGTDKMAELLLEWFDPALVDPGFSHLRQCLGGQVLQRDAVLPRMLA